MYPFFSTVHSLHSSIRLLLINQLGGGGVSIYHLNEKVLFWGQELEKNAICKLIYYYEYMFFLLFLVIVSALMGLTLAER